MRFIHAQAFKLISRVLRAILAQKNKLKLMISIKAKNHSSSLFTSIIISPASSSDTINKIGAQQAAQSS